MKNPLSALTDLRRPSLLIRAARHGVAEYDRNRRLERLVDVDTSNSAATLKALLDAESEVETRRVNGEATYSVSRHIELLVALMGEARHLAQPSRAG